MTSEKFQPASRPVAAEREATHRAIARAEIVGIRIRIFHVPGAERREERDQRPAVAAFGDGDRGVAGRAGFLPVIMPAAIRKKRWAGSTSTGAL